MGYMREMAGALWEGHTPLKTGLRAHGHAHRQTDTQYPPVLGGYNYVFGVFPPSKQP